MRRFPQFAQALLAYSQPCQRGFLLCQPLESWLQLALPPRCGQPGNDEVLSNATLAASSPTPQPLGRTLSFFSTFPGAPAGRSLAAAAG